MIYKVCAVCAVLLQFLNPCFAEVNLVDRDGWKMSATGFVEFDSFYDSKGVLAEAPGSGPVDPSSTYYGANGKMVFSVRNSRLGFSLVAPAVNGMITRGLIEFDFLGYEPAFGGATPATTEASYYTAPTARLRHGFVSLEKEGCLLLIGQTWSLFGWQPLHFLTTTDVNPSPGMVFQRTPQITFLHTVKFAESHNFVSAISIARPAERASGLPTLDAGIRWYTNAIKSGIAANAGEAHATPMSVGVSGTYRQLNFPGTGAVPSSIESTTAYGLALDTILPVIATGERDDNLRNTLTFTGELTRGRGYADHLGGFTGNLAGAGQGVQPDLDPGLAGADAAGHFQPLNLQTWNTQVQYFLPTESTTWVDLGYGQVLSDNVPTLKAMTGKIAYNRAEILFANIFHDWTKQFRTAVEYAQFTTTYVDTQVATDNRYMFTAYLRL